MPSRLLPETLNFLEQAKRNVVLQGYWPLAQLARLRETLNDTSGELLANLEFGSRAGFHYLDGKVTASLEVICQRCLAPMQQELSGHFSFVLISNEDDIELLPAEVETYLIIGNEQSVIDIVEDELLLSLPMVPIHSNDCSEFLSQHNEQRRKDAANENPFAVLKDLKID